MSKLASRVELDASALDMLFPLHVILDPAGRIVRIGPTLGLMVPAVECGADFFSTFTITRPRNIQDIAALARRCGKKLSVCSNDNCSEPLHFRCVATIIPSSNQTLVDFTVAEDLTTLMQRFSLTNADFRPNDVSLDLVYALETQKTMLEDSKALTLALSEAKEQAETAANVDPVTGIANRRAFYARLQELCEDDEDRTPYALLQVDLDKFKAINDTLGHAAGDDVLTTTALLLVDFAGKAGLAARLGGDEFAILIPNPPAREILGKRAEEIIDDISQPRTFAGQVSQVGASVGISFFTPSDMLSVDQPLLEADIALYKAKEYGAAAVFLTPAMLSTHLQTTETIIQLETAIAQAQFVPYFQPQVDIVTGAVVGVEVLARWCHPERGILPPGVWIEAADRAGLMPAIDQIVLTGAIAILADWRRRGITVGKTSFNLTAKNLRSTEFVERLEDDLLAAGISASDVQIELLESILFDNADDNLIEACFRLHDAGFKLALDDFGTGHASIATLIDTPVSVLKIDKSFVTGLDRRPKLQRITKAILAMSAKMGLEVIAEGVENSAELTLLRSFNCRIVQGYVFAPPLSADDCIAWIADRTGDDDMSKPDCA